MTSRLGRLNAISTAAIVVISVLTAGVGLPLVATGTASAAPTPISGCTTISSAGTYELTTDVSGVTGRCIVINASNVLFDGNGHTLTAAASSATAGVYVASPTLTAPISNVTVRNLTVDGFAHGVRFSFAIHSQATGVTATNGGTGILVGETSGYREENSVTNSTLVNNDKGIVLTADVDGTEVRNNTIQGGDVGIEAPDTLFGSTHNSEPTIVDNAITGTGVGIRLDDVFHGTVSNNVVEDAPVGISIESASQLDVDDNHVVNSTVVGIRVLRGRYDRFDGNAVTDAAIGLQLGGASDDGPRHTSFTNTTIVDSGPYGIHLSSADVDTTFANTTVTNSGGWDFHSTNGSVGVAATGFHLDGETTVSFNATDVALRAVSSPPAPPTGYLDIGHHVEATNTATASELLLNVSYADADVAAAGVNESELRLWRYDGSWAQVPPPNDVNTTANDVTAHITSFSVFAPLAPENAAPVVDAGPDATVDEGTAFVRTVSFTDDSTSWTATVDYGDGSGPQTFGLSGTSFTVTHSYADDGTNTVSVEVCDDGGRCGTDDLELTVTNVAPSVSATGDTLFDGETAHVNASVVDPGVDDTHTATIDWGDGTTEPVAVAASNGAGQVNATHVYPADGSYTATVTVTDDDGGSSTASAVVTVLNHPPTAAFSIAPGTPSTADTVSFDGSTSTDVDGSIQQYAWDFGDGTTGTGPTPSHSYADDGTYTVTLTVTDDDGASDQTSAQVTVTNVAPVATFSFTPTDPEAGSAVSFDATASSDPDGLIQSYAWDFDDGTTSSGASPSHTFASAGDFTVELTVTDDDGATTTYKQTVTVVVFSGPLVVDGEAVGPPEDQDGDGLYEDLDGDGTLGGKDVATLSKIVRAYLRGALSLSQAQIDALDFDGDGDLDQKDMAGLARTLGGGKGKGP